MARSSIFVLLSALAASSLAQSQQTTGEIVWASFAFIMHGERTPLIGNIRNAETLTPAGAHELFSQGNAFRSRYLRPLYVDLEANETFTTREPIRNLFRTVFDNTQVNVLALDDPYISTGALAFMQGLYPPNEDAFSLAMGGDDIAKDTATGTFTEYPMGGYQYPAVKSYSTLEEGSVGLGGNARCSNWIKSARNDLMKDGWGDDKLNGRGTDGFYRQIFQEEAFNGTSVLPLSDADLNIYNSYPIWDFVRYMRDHNQTVSDHLKGNGNSNDNLDKVSILKDYADEFTFVQNSAADKSIRAMAGKTLAQEVLDAFASNYQSDGDASKLTLAFGSFEPIRAFASLAGLSGNDWNGAPSTWKEIPQNGAAMVFELIGRVPGKPSQYPTHNDLKVRFYYRRSPGSGSGFRRYGMFGSSTTEAGMPWNDFEKAMKNVAVDVNSWCGQCNTQTRFCQARSASSVFSPRSKSAVISGVIGAAIMVALFGIAIVSLVFCFGMRVHRRGKGNPLGGFKGAEKMASDTDLAIAKSGAHHERVGSWELRDGSDVPGGGAGLVKTGPSANTRKMDDDAILEMGMKPVQPRESV